MFIDFIRSIHYNIVTINKRGKNKMTHQEFSDKLSEAIFMNIEEVESIKERNEANSLCFSVKTKNGENFEVQVKKTA